MLIKVRDGLYNMDNVVGITRLGKFITLHFAGKDDVSLCYKTEQEAFEDFNNLTKSLARNAIGIYCKKGK